LQAQYYVFLKLADEVKQAFNTEMLAFDFEGGKYWKI
jgi:hypothetical protein